VHGARTARVLAAAIVAAIPFTWFVLGFAAQFGFYNATLTLLLLLASWLAWLETRQPGCWCGGAQPRCCRPARDVTGCGAPSRWLSSAPVCLSFVEAVRIREAVFLAVAALPVPVYIVTGPCLDFAETGLLWRLMVDHAAAARA
jgi:hypothetical protein